ncbi:DUF4198 domain-containing protein [Pelistega europaea]|uniref:DUF4198 domain-containing protein n=1 Tax=Pelistega europaea TaxID=106147 RepID=A0A7Y4LE38_9BURK|nr:DUF4198 domain-containing protein [Pelistega europaea]NOL50516.1 DUF4198 domain-containing protein [Pelistega europaea]
MKKYLLALGLLSTATLASAHNIWVESVPSQQNQYVVKFGHETTESYPENKLKKVQYLNQGGELKSVNVFFSKGEAYFTVNDANIIFVEFNNGIWSKLPNGKYVEKTKQQEPSAVSSTNPIKYGKAILKWNEQAFKPHQQAYEIIPLTQPKVGEPLQVLVLHDGKPISGAKVSVSEDMPAQLSDDKGVALFNQVKLGENRIWAGFEEKSTSPNYDKKSIEYLLTFTVK